MKNLGDKLRRSLEISDNPEGERVITLGGQQRRDPNLTVRMGGRGELGISSIPSQPQYEEYVSEQSVVFPVRKFYAVAVGRKIEFSIIGQRPKLMSKDFPMPHIKDSPPWLRRNNGFKPTFRRASNLRGNAPELAWKWRNLMFLCNIQFSLLTV